MNKVVIEITSKGYVTTVEIEGKVHKTEWIRTGYGASGECLDMGFEDNEEIDEDLYQALEDNDLLDISYALSLFDEEEGKSS